MIKKMLGGNVRTKQLSSATLIFELETVLATVSNNMVGTFKIDPQEQTADTDYICIMWAI